MSKTSVPYDLINEMFGPEIRKGDFQALLQLDRYAVKGDRNNVKVGDVIIAVVDDSNPKYPRKDFGRVTAINGDLITFRGTMRSTMTEDEANKDASVYYTEPAGSEGLVYAWKEYTVHRRMIDVPLDWKWADFTDRLVQGIMAIDERYTKKYDQAFATRLHDHIANERLVFGGRIQASVGAQEKYALNLGYTAYNCYVIPSPKDSRWGIIETLGTMVEIMSRGGGVGINLSTLRPRFAKVRGVNGTSSGAVSWGGLFSFATGLVEQAGSRRGALMLQLHVSHPDIVEFITVKRQSGMITNANLSVQITKEFMDAVAQDREWHLIFPVTSHPEYDEKWGTVYQDIHDWLNAGLPVDIYETVKARDLFKLIIESAHASAEPGFVVYDRMNDGEMSSTQDLMKDDKTDSYVLRPESRGRKAQATPWNNTYYMEKQVATNPCGEVPLAPWGVCNLGHINLAEFVKDGDVDWDMLRSAVHDGVRALDCVIDYTEYHFEAIREHQMKVRRIGLGTMGLADMLIDLKLRYGSPESIEFIDKLYGFITNEAYRASALLAKERGRFPAYSDAILAARVPMLLSDDVRELIKKYGLRNSHLITQAPTGTTGTKSGRHGFSVSTGIEPFFDLAWTRTSRVGTTVEYLGKAKQYMEQTGATELTDYFVAAMSVNPDGTPKITPQEHVNVQAAIQKWNDSAISKTTNVPSSFTVEETRKLYQYGFEKGLIGITIYRDGSRDEQVLTSATNPKKESDEQASNTSVEHTFAGFKPYKRPEALVGHTYKIETAFGTMYVTVNRHPETDVIEEIFLTIGKAGADISAIASGLAIAVSGLLSPRVSYRTQEEKVKWLVDKFLDISGSTSVGFGSQRVSSLPDAIAKVFLKHVPEAKTGDGMTEDEQHQGSPALLPRGRTLQADLCPACGKPTFVKRDGCQTCLKELGGCGQVSRC